MLEEQLIVIEDRAKLLDKIISDLQTDLKRLTKETEKLKTKLSNITSTCGGCCSKRCE
jgi:hypothetical protein